MCVLMIYCVLNNLEKIGSNFLVQLAGQISENNIQEFLVGSQYPESKNLVRNPKKISLFLLVGLSPGVWEPQRDFWIFFVGVQDFLLMYFDRHSYVLTVKTQEVNTYIHLSRLRAAWRYVTRFSRVWLTKL